MGRITSSLAVLAPLSLLVGCDHATKGIAKAELEGASPVQLIRGIVDLNYVENTDIAFNLLRAVPLGIRTPALLISGAIACVGLLVMLLSRARWEQGVPRLGLVLIAAGAIGNYADRVFRGYVVDFVHLHRWPVFNVADVYIVAGFVLLAWSSLRRKNGALLSVSPQASANPRKAPSDPGDLG